MTALTFAVLKGAAEPSIGASLFKMVLALAAVIASILVVSKVLQYLKGGARAPQRRATGALEVLSRQSLGKGLQLAVVRFNGREVLVGIAGQQISFHEPASAASDDEGVLEEPSAAAIGASSAAVFEGPSTSGWTTTNRDLAAMIAASGTNGRALALGRSATTSSSFLERLRDATARR